MGETGCPVEAACRALGVSRAGYYRWRSGKLGPRAEKNQRIAGLVEQIHAESPDKGYRRIRDDLARCHQTPINDKRALRICRSLGIRSTIKYAAKGCTRGSRAPQHTAENLLDRDFHADRPNEKGLTDVTEFRYYAGPCLRKLYLSAILDLCDRRIVAFALRDTNDTALVHETLDQAIAANPDAHPLFHSDRGFQYTTRIFHDKLASAGMTQSMSRVGKCIDNGPMEGFWGNPQVGALLRQALHQPGSPGRHDPNLYRLLQLPPPSAPPGRPHTPGSPCTLCRLNTKMKY